MQTSRFNPVHEFGAEAGRAQSAYHFAILYARLLKNKQVGRGDHVAFHALNFRDGDDFAGAVTQALQMADHVDCRRNLLANSPDGQVHTGHESHRFEAGECIARAVGVGGRHRAVVAGVHGLKHVQRGLIANLADDDPVGPHTQGVDHQVLNGDFALAFDVCRPGLQGDDVLLPELQFSRVLDGKNTLIGRDEAGQDVQERGLARAGAARNHNVQTRNHTGLHELHGLRRNRAERNILLHGDRFFGEFTNGQRRPDQ